MVVKQKVTGTAWSMPTGIAFGTLCGISLLGVLLYILASMIQHSVLELERSGYWMLTVILVSSYTAGRIASELIKRKRIPVCMTAGVGMALILLTIEALFFSGELGIGWTAPILCIFGSTSAALRYTGKRRSKRKKRSIR